MATGSASAGSERLPARLLLGTLVIAVIAVLAGCSPYGSNQVDRSAQDSGQQAGTGGGRAGTGGGGGGGGKGGGCKNNIEICDGKDNDCDGKTDEEPASESCRISHATADCVKGKCVLAKCDDLFGDCDKDPSNGCETPLDMSTNCGECGRTCLGAKHAIGVSCDKGECAFQQCKLGYGDCDGDKSNGCEKKLDTMSDCGVCGKECTGASCAGGMCSKASCKKGFADCDRDPSDGCETSLTSVTNCVMCGNGCTIDNATASCETGTCVFVKCKVGFGDCDNDTSNGCETRLDTLEDCGACGTECTVAVGIGFCTGGACTPIKCLEGKADCDGDTSNGCEISLSSQDNCAFCGNKCDPSGDPATTCRSGSCQLSDCGKSFFDCDQDPANGCESELKDNANCGACGQACSLPNATSSCAARTCEFVSCNQGFADCNKDTSDGCEADLNSAANCGACGVVCATAPAHATGGCVNGVCSGVACEAGWGDCNKDMSDGCEANLLTDTKNCGSCGHACNIAGPMCCSGKSCSWWCG